ncbi:hypothetical protein M3579_16550 [Bacillus pumilus]|uniref:hypothetical protein n=1 Tax=Bacillus pumilus TaxID=1408 RepID=UPI00203D8904|nr:hypothetical protein [Bacillus pumilus]MCM3037574.1 hypothetical protein [Bacillus pumilus]
MLKKFEWIGFIIAILGLVSTIFLERQTYYYSYIVIGIGAAITFISFFLRKIVKKPK